MCLSKGDLRDPDELSLGHDLEVNEMQERLRFHFMNPFQKWKYSKRRRFPWKLILQIFNIILVTTQVSQTRLSVCLSVCSHSSAQQQYYTMRTHLDIPVRRLLPVGGKKETYNMGMETWEGAWEWSLGMRLVTLYPHISTTACYRLIPSMLL